MIERVNEIMNDRMIIIETIIVRILVRIIVRTYVSPIVRVIVKNNHKNEMLLMITINSFEMFLNTYRAF